MDSIRHFMKLDWLAFKPYRKYLLLNLIPIIFLLIENPGFTFQIKLLLCILVLPMMATIVSGYFFANEEKSDMQRLYISLPINKKEIVIARYLNGIIYGLSGILGMALVSAVYTQITSSGSLQETINMSGFAIGFFFVLISIQFPAMFKLGFMKGQVFSIVLFLSVFWGTQLIAGKAFFQALIYLSNTIGLVFVGLLFLTISVSVSTAIYKVKEG